MAETKHTPTPYRAEISDRLSDSSDCWVIDSEAGSIAEMMCPADVEEATAKFIVRACNSHDDLVEAVKEAIAYFEEVEEYANYDCHTISEKLRATLAKATGDSQ